MEIELNLVDILFWGWLIALCSWKLRKWISSNAESVYKKQYEAKFIDEKIKLTKEFNVKLCKVDKQMRPLGMRLIDDNTGNEMFPENAYLNLRDIIKKQDVDNLQTRNKNLVTNTDIDWNSLFSQVDDE